jgi:hypothetical protein
MSKGKDKFIEDAARVIDGRVASLKAELERKSKHNPQPPYLASDRSAILEAELLAKMIRALGLRPYRGDPYEVALKRWSKGEVKDEGDSE